MFFIPGIVIAILTFPGVIVHEAAHMMFCRLRKVPVFDVKFFQFDWNTAGYVVHGKSENFLTDFLISMGPFFLNSLLCILICFPASLPVYLFNDMNPVSIFLIWLGVSIGIHAFPSNQDANVIWNEAKTEVKNRNMLAILSFPLVIIIFIANVLRVVWFDVIYGVLIGVVLPGFIFKSML